MNYTIFIQVDKSCWNHTKLSELEVNQIVQNIKRGTKSILIHGKQLQLENLKEIKIYSCDTAEQYYKAVNSNEIKGDVNVDAATGHAYFKPLTLVKFNNDVTADFFAKVTELNIADTPQKTRSCSGFCRLKCPFLLDCC